MNEDIIDVMASSDAAFDGRTYSALGRADRNRYRDRCRAALAAIEASGTHVVVPVKLPDGFLFSDEDWRDIITSLPKVAP